MNHRAAALVFAALSCGCATQNERVVLLPGPGGKTGSIVVRSAEREVTLDRPYASVEIAGRSVRESSLPDRDVVERYEPVLAARPPRPRTYLVFFEFDQAVMTSASVREFEEIKREIAGWTAPEVLIVGHADLKGTEEYNDELSRRRALAIREALLAVGVPAVRIELAARGKREPLVPTPDGIPYVRNRRVEIRVR